MGAGLDHGGEFQEWCDRPHRDAVQAAATLKLPRGRGGDDARSRALYERLARHYDAAGLAAVGIESFRPLVEGLIADLPPGPWLDLGCGTGAMLAAGLPRTKPGFGLDASLAMLQRGARPRLAGDLRCLPVANASVALLTAFFDVVNHLPSSRELAAALEEAQRVLVPRGQLIFDLSAPLHLRLWNGTEDTLPVTEGRLLRRATWQEDAGRIDVSWTLERADGQREDLGHLSEWSYPLGLVEGLLRIAGFAGIASRALRRWRGQPLRWLVSATKSD